MDLEKNIFFDLSEMAHLGHDAIIGKTVRMRKPSRCSVGDHSILDDFTYISCGLRLGRYTHIGPNCILIGGEATIHIGDFVNISGGSRLVAASHDFSAGGLSGPAIPQEFAHTAVVADIHLADHVLFGTGTVVLPGTHVPEGVSTGAMTMLTPELPLEPWSVYAGIPAKRIGSRERTEILRAAQQLGAEPSTPE